MDQSNQEQWLLSAENKSRRELEKEVKRARQEARDKSAGQVSLLPLPAKKLPAAVVPVRLNIEMSPTQFARYEKLWEQVRKNTNASADRVETMLEMMENYIKPSPLPNPKRSARADLLPAVQPPVQIHIHQCPDCAMATARHKCQSPGCDHTHFLEVHHIVPRSVGGTNEVNNLQLLCSACHKLRHYNKLPNFNFQVKSPAEVYQWRHTSKQSFNSFSQNTNGTYFNIPV